jgi:acetyl-CoA synthetase
VYCCAVPQWDEEHINWNFDVRKGPINVEWYKGGTTNICYNALDRHVAAGEREHSMARLC